MYLKYTRGILSMLQKRIWGRGIYSIWGIGVWGATGENKTHRGEGA